jgi:hypothetical protein
VPRPQEVFISYSRKNRDFLDRWDEALKSRGREAWVDWEDIRPAEEFMKAIYGAIEGADTFIFVLTPDSVASIPLRARDCACDELSSISICRRRILRTLTEDRMPNKAKAIVYRRAARPPLSLTLERL